ncbi:MAG: hypothetical protein K9L57_11970 [Spirochaetaceae bacterium]|nr:hypothetical protein [Spirochaetia bacterium]MCF7952344.1 hypothetical protein [Spirochaetaceae bacterium]
MKRVQLKCNTYTALALYFTLILSALSLPGCTPVADTRALLKEDLRPPVFLSIAVHNPHSISLVFSEPIEYRPASYSCSPALEQAETRTEAEQLHLSFKNPMQPGTEYSLECSVSDPAGNTHTVLAKFFGFNPNIPAIRLNEITTQGSASHPDKIELRVLEDGNTAGLCLIDGTRDFIRQYKVLPPVEVKAGEYLVVHTKPVGTPDEIDETASPVECRAADSVMEAWDMWMDGGSGLSGNNGVISLYSHSNGELLDGFLYSNRTSSSDEDYRGFGSLDTMSRADQLWLQEGWIAAGRLIAPEDAVNPDDSTATRSICRLPQGEDSNSPGDWYIVDTSQSSFGSENSLIEYVP